MKRLRRHAEPQQIRFFMCGEYGENTDLTTTRTIGRPHYHALIFGYDFKDKRLHTTNHQGDPIYTSETLEKLWPFGFNTIGELTFETAAYTARYVMKKINGEEADDHYETYDRATGEIAYLEKEFSRSSNRPGIGAKWFEKYRHDLDKGFITMRGIKMPPPKYYNDLYQRDHEEQYMFLARKKQESIDLMDPDQTLDRLRVKEEIKARQTSKLKRVLSS